jgi:acetate---CoA ligase (ADP-forming)
MKKSNLSNFFYPKKIAIIGASEDTNKVGGVLMRKSLKFKGEIIPINPNHTQIFNKKTYPSIKDVEKKIDIAVIATPKETVKEIVRECVNKKIKFIIIISAGFSEIGDKKTQDEILDIIKKGNSRILGPNCFGIFNSQINLDLTFANTTPKKGNTAVISQSGALWSYFSDIKKIRYSKFVSLGNMSDIEFTDIIEFLNKDKQTKKIILYIEKLKDGKRFIKTCKNSKKQIIAIKAGSSKQGSIAAVSHTGSLATDFKIYKGVFKQSKVKQIENLFKNIKIPKGKTMIITNAGGAGALIADECENQKIELIKEQDILGTAQAQDYKKALVENEKIKSDSIIIILTPQKMSEPENSAKVIADFSKTTNKKIVACFLGEASISKAQAILKRANIYCFTGKKEIENITK